ncbi:hypothetical protein ACFY8O_19475 [Streptomyces argenteolus]|uniref:Helix-turn-helix protein n=1 Tax=Streptomyces argenteolus TaxID=67274 RepID=A0ABW6XAK0_9ACTN
MLWHAIAPSRGYTKAANELVRSQRLSSDAKILLLYVQGLPEDRRAVALSEHARALGITGRAYQKAKELLVTHGYLYEWRQQGGRGFWTTEQLLANVALGPEEARRLRDGGPAPVAVSPGERNPTVGQPEGRVAGRYTPVDEEPGKNSSHPPTEPAPQVAELPAREPEDDEAERVLLSLRHAHRSLHLGVAEARKLVKLAVVWLRRGVTAAEMRRVLVSDLPVSGVRSAVGFLRHRLVQKLPEDPAPLPERPGPARPTPALTVCTGPGEEHLFRPEPGAHGEDAETRCGPCRREAAWAAWAETRSAQLATEAAALADEDSDPYAHTPWREKFAAVEAAKDAGTAVPGLCAAPGPGTGVPGR